MPSKRDYKDKDGNEDPVAFKMAVFAWKEDFKVMRVGKDRYRDNESNAWASIYNQCSPELKNKLEGAEEYEKAKETNKMIQLLKMIRNYCCQFNTLNGEYVSIVGAFKNLFFFWQKTDQANTDYHKDFMALVKVIKEYGGPESITHFPNMIKKELKSKNPGIDMSKATPDQMKEAKKTVCKKFLAALMLNGANEQKYGDLKRGMAENHVTGTSEYPESPEVLLCILTVYKPPAGWNKHRQDAGVVSKEGAMFTQTEGHNWKANVTCHNCKKKGHITREGPNKNKAEVDEQIHANVQEEDLDEGDNIFVQKEEREIVNKNYILLDN
jgi:hypothetical protein